MGCGLPEDGHGGVQAGRQERCACVCGGGGPGGAWYMYMCKVCAAAVAAAAALPFCCSAVAAGLHHRESKAGGKKIRRFAYSLYHHVCVQYALWCCAVRHMEVAQQRRTGPPTPPLGCWAALQHGLHFLQTRATDRSQSVRNARQRQTRGEWASLCCVKQQQTFVRLHMAAFASCGPHVAEHLNQHVPMYLNTTRCT